MKLAVTYENGMVFQHFGKCQNFLIANIEEGQMIQKSLLPSNGQGHGALVSLLKAADVDVLICGGCGEGARKALKEAQITVISGAIGNAEVAIDAYRNGALNDQPSGQCHHHHEGGHDCSTAGHCHKD